MSSYHGVEKVSYFHQRIIHEKDSEVLMEPFVCNKSDSTGRYGQRLR